MHASLVNQWWQVALQGSTRGDPSVVLRPPTPTRGCASSLQKTYEAAAELGHRDDKRLNHD